MKNRSGFTLIELIVVITIIGILVTVVALNYEGIIGGAEKSKVQADGSQVYNAVQLYRTQKRRFPQDLADLNTLIPVNNGKPLLDPWKRDYLLDFRDGHVVLRSLGADGSPGGEGSDADLEVVDGEPGWKD